jgi:uncharacterized membrane protein
VDCCDCPSSCLRLIGLAEILGAIGLVLPAAVHIAPILVPLAAVGLALVMAGAAAVHARRKEAPMVVMNAVLLVLAVFVAWAVSGRIRLRRNEVPRVVRPVYTKHGAD